jgi:DNA repair exonuclease SbcCD ATPase subunit
MLTQLAHSLLLAQSAQPAAPGWAWALVICLIAVIGTLAWIFSQLRGTQRRLAQLTVEHESTTGAHRELLERERKQAKTLDEKRDEIRDLKRDLAGQKKKNHTVQEETKSLRKDLRDLTDRLAQATKQARPAFAEKPEPAPEKKVAAKPEPEPAPAPAPVADTNDELATRVTALESELRTKSEALSADRAALREARAELKKLKKRVEGFRRVDLVSAGKVELLEDRVHSLGRQYYDAVSELAVLKGEVSPPPPRELGESPRKRDEIAKTATDEDSGADNNAGAGMPDEPGVPPAETDEKSVEGTA